MLSIPMKFVFLAVYLTCFSNAGENPEEKEVRKSFVRYLKEDEGKHQVMILINEEETNETIKQNDFITKISRHVSTMLVSTQHLKNSRKNYIKHIGKNPRGTTLFVSIVPNGRKLGIVPLGPLREIITDLSNQYQRPKYLIVHLAKNLTWTYKTALQNHWLKQFLDTTVLQVTEKGTNTCKRLFEQNQRFLTRYEFNPYSSIISKKKDWLNSQWFPDKTKNLHKHPVILRPGQFYPEDFMVYKVFAESINSTTQQLLTADRSRPYAGFQCIYVSYFHTDRQSNWHISHFNNIEELLAVVPRLGAYDKEDLVSWKLVLVILANFLLVIVLRLVFMLMKFDRDSWRMLDIFAVILGLNFLNVPKRVIERIVACCLLFGCMIYSGYLHTLLTEVELETIPEQEVKTLEELANLNLTLYSNYKVLTNEIQKNRKMEFNQALCNRTFNYKEGYGHYQCLNDLERHKNVSCEFSLNYLLAIAKDAEGKHLIKNATIVEKPLVMVYTAYLAEDGEVLMGAFNKYLVRVIDSGLMSKWKRYPSIKLPLFSTEIENSDVNTSAVFHRRVLLYLAFGYGLALIVFFGELLIDLHQRKGLKQKILRELRRFKTALCYILQKCKRGCIWLLAKLRDGCKFVRSKLRNAWVAVIKFCHRIERR